MDLRKLKKLIDLVQESGIAELEITEGEEKVKIVKGGTVSITPASAAARPGSAAAPSSSPTRSSPGSSPPASAPTGRGCSARPTSSSGWAGS